MTRGVNRKFFHELQQINFTCFTPAGNHIFDFLHDNLRIATKVYYARTGIKRIDENRAYHAGRDEIEAYAHCVYLDFKMKRPTIPVGDLIRYAGTYKVSKNLTGIQKLFRTDKYNEVVPLLLRKILTWERKYTRFS